MPSYSLPEDLLEEIKRLVPRLGGLVHPKPVYNTVADAVLDLKAQLINNGEDWVWLPRWPVPPKQGWKKNHKITSCLAHHLAAINRCRILTLQQHKSFNTGVIPLPSAGDVAAQPPNYDGDRTGFNDAGLGSSNGHLSINQPVGRHIERSMPALPWDAVERSVEKAVLALGITSGDAREEAHRVAYRVASDLQRIASSAATPGMPPAVGYKMFWELATQLAAESAATTTTVGLGAASNTNKPNNGTSKFKHGLQMTIDSATAKATTFLTNDDARAYSDVVARAGGRQPFFLQIARKPEHNVETATDKSVERNAIKESATNDTNLSFNAEAAWRKRTGRKRKRTISPYLHEQARVIDPSDDGFDVHSRNEYKPETKNAQQPYEMVNGMGREHLHELTDMYDDDYYLETGVPVERGTGDYYKTEIGTKQAYAFTAEGSKKVKVAAKMEHLHELTDMYDDDYYLETGVPVERGTSNHYKTEIGTKQAYAFTAEGSKKVKVAAKMDQIDEATIKGRKGATVGSTRNHDNTDVENYQVHRKDSDVQPGANNLDARAQRTKSEERRQDVDRLVEEFWANF